MDPVEHAVHVLRLDEQLSSRRIAFEQGSTPRRAALTQNTAYVPLVSAGQLAAIDLESATIVGTVPVCASPEGLAVDEHLLHLACRDGSLLRFEVRSDLPERLAFQDRVRLDDDLRDVVRWPGGLAVSRFGTAEVLVLDSEGKLLRRIRPPAPSGLVAAVAWRLLPSPDGKLVLAHQVNSTEALGGVYYGGGCGSISSPAVSLLDPENAAETGETATDPSNPGEQSPVVPQVRLARAAGTLDIALSGGRVQVAIPGNALATQRAERLGLPEATARTDAWLPGLVAVDPGGPDASAPCFTLGESHAESAVPISLETVPAGPLAGKVLALTAYPSQVKVLGLGPAVPLPGPTEKDTGFELFQMTVAESISCASCHPMGRADAHVWNFVSHGPRRTQSLEGGVSHLGAFHWDGEFPSWGEFVESIMIGRMGLREELSEETLGAFLSFVDAVPTPASTPDEASAVARGRALFESEATACSTCHSGPHWTDNAAYDVGTGGRFVTPSLVGVRHRAPYMHDGCAPDLEARFGICGGGDEHGKTSHLSDQDIADLVAFMRTF
jgi:mono/diheme cytochrome c family protein